MRLSLFLASQPFQKFKGTKDFQYSVAIEAT